MICQDEQHKGEFKELGDRKRFCPECATKRKRAADNKRLRQDRASTSKRIECRCNLCERTFKMELDYPYFGIIPRPTHHDHCPTCYRMLSDTLYVDEDWVKGVNDADFYLYDENNEITHGSKTSSVSYVVRKYDRDFYR